MAEKILQTRIINKHADLATWASSTLPLKTGEIALARVETSKPDGNGGFYKVPTYLMKVGDGEKTFSQLEWLAAPASDVYEWAKAATKPGYTATEIARGTSNVATDLKAAEDAIVALQTAIGGSGSVVTMIQNAIQALDENTWAAEDGIKFVTAVGETDGKISVTRRALTADDIPALGIGKITSLQDALNLKANASDVKQTTDAISARLDENGDIDVAIKAAKKAGDDAQAYAEGVNTAFDAYKTTNDAEVAAVRGIAEAARTETEVDSQIDAKIATFKTSVTDKIDERVVKNATDIGAETTRATKAEEALATRVKANEDAISTLNAATTLEGVGTLAQRPAKGKAEGAIWIATDNNKEYVWDGSAWVELGDTTAELDAISKLTERVGNIETDLGADGDTTKAIAAAQKAADDAQADADEANRLIGIINGSDDGSIAKAVADATSALQGYADGKASAAQTAAEATAKSYTDTEVKKANDAAATAQTAIDTHIANKENPHEVTKAQVGLGNVENKSTATIKSEFTGSVASGNEGFVTGGAVYTAIDDAKKAANSYTDTEVKKVADDLDAAETEISTIKNNYARVKDNQLVYGQGDAEMVIIFDCGGAN